MTNKSDQSISDLKAQVMDKSDALATKLAMVEMTKCVVAEVNISASTGTSWWYKITRWLRIRLGRYTVEESLLDHLLPLPPQGQWLPHHR